MATQAPMKSTVNDVWRMVWEMNSRTIIMLCDLQEKDDVREVLYTVRHCMISRLHDGTLVMLAPQNLVAIILIAHSGCVCQPGGVRAVLAREGDKADIWEPNCQQQV